MGVIGKTGETSMLSTVLQVTSIGRSVVSSIDLLLNCSNCPIYSVVHVASVWCIILRRQKESYGKRKPIGSRGIGKILGLR